MRRQHLLLIGAILFFRVFATSAEPKWIYFAANADMHNRVFYFLAPSTVIHKNNRITVQTTYINESEMAKIVGNINNDFNKTKKEPILFLNVKEKLSIGYVPPYIHRLKELDKKPSQKDVHMIILQEEFMNIFYNKSSIPSFIDIDLTQNQFRYCSSNTVQANLKEPLCNEWNKIPQQSPINSLIFIIKTHFKQ